MSDIPSRHDAWQAAEAYDTYMGRWSRPVADLFLDWLAPRTGLDWLDVGCGTGALTAAILQRCEPASVLAIEPSGDFLAGARAAIDDMRVDFQVGDAAGLAALPDASRDAVVSGLVLNFLPDPVAALREMLRIARPGSDIAFYVWDYPGGGVEFLEAFWRTAILLDPGARDLSEATRFAFCTEDGVGTLLRQAGVSHWHGTALTSRTPFRDFDDFWQPFTLGTGPAPGFCASLETAARDRLRDTLATTLPRQEDGSIALSCRAWAFRTTVT